jgi:hypothetical protein
LQNQKKRSTFTRRVIVFTIRFLKGHRMKRIKNNTFLVATLLGTSSLFPEQSQSNPILDEINTAIATTQDAAVDTAHATVEEIKAKGKEVRDKALAAAAEIKRAAEKKQAEYERAQAAQKIKNATGTVVEVAKENVEDGARHLKEKVSSLSDKAKQQGVNLVEKAKQTVNEGTDLVKAQAQKTKNEVNYETAMAGRALEKNAEKGKNLIKGEVNSLRDSFKSAVAEGKEEIVNALTRQAEEEKEAERGKEIQERS